MPHITRESLMSLESYAKVRPAYRSDMIAHKKNRSVMLGEHVTLIFEDEKTMRYQIQEMLRAERTFEDAGIQDELDAYNPLIPDGSNWKATMMIEYPDPDERQVALAKLKGIEERVWVRVGDHARSYAIADEDMERENAEKTSAVHFLRFELETSSIAAAKSGAAIQMGVDLAAYPVDGITLTENVRAALLADLA
ncbi:MAG TPA: DUF3501 family protein [Thiobacillus sp.]|nr:MAG: hypothetical protein B7Y50_12345 [Hydrogenophilales bacterium 28-61-11]OYZ58233.1 MAG: hypothetical protein B7Y21_03900 [Hydrogenophilales bacterium 16-61-112]OZA46621.1 MAG: hypothetical protein B7X81_06685 [Hydrogenophilales bacterium 17-61-76]HQT31537.1 DUF3501 family protein [Thiobacillus sp.]HQT70980.1 DUF3501 family protein [Thiobacillus sp.]